MNQHPTNTAAWLTASQADFQLQSAPYPLPRENEIVVKNHALAINPVDWMTQLAGGFLFSWMKTPFILGSDLAGEVVAVGKGVTRFNVGDRVLAHAVGTDKKRNSPAEGAFQAYTVVLAHMAAPIPDTLSYESAAVLPLALSTAACGLFQTDQLALQHPSLSVTPTGKTLLIWGGSTSVGSNAIQLAVAAGYEVITTASPKNFGYVRQLGASQVFDYNSPTVTTDIIDAFQGKTLAGALAVGSTAAEACLAIVGACQGNRFVSIATFPLAFEGLARGSSVGFHLLRQAPTMLRFVGLIVLKSLTRRIRTNSIFGTTLMENEVGPLIYEKFLPEALAQGRYRAVPEPFVIGKGLAYVQAGLEKQRQGVSAQKVVISL